jgi:hypothetical protein
VVYYPQSQYVAAAMLISSLAIHTNITGNGLIPVIDVPNLNLTTTGTQNAPTFGTNKDGSSKGNPYVVSTPLSGAVRARGMPGSVVNRLAVLSLAAGALGLLQSPSLVLCHVCKAFRLSNHPARGPDTLHKEGEYIGWHVTPVCSGSING